MKAFIASIALACAPLSALPAPPMSPSGAFNAGNSLGIAANPDVATGITESAASTTVPNYSATSPRSALYSGMKNLGPDGLSETTYCQTDGVSSPDSKTKITCDATNLMTDFNIHKPVIHIDKTLDPLMVKRRAIQDDPASASLPINNSTSACKPETTTSADQTREETCTDVIGMPSSSSCEMPQEVDVLQHNRYQCDEGKPGTSHSCSKTLTTDCSTGCYPNGIRLVTYSGFGGLVTTDAGGGYYYLNLGTVQPNGDVQNNYYSGWKHQMYEARYTIQVDNINDIDTFTLEKVFYDDSTAIWINGTFVWGNRGGSTLETCMTTITSYDSDGNPVYTPYLGATNGVDACSTSSSYWDISGQSLTASVGELKSYLHSGENEIVIRLVVGDNGEVLYRFKTLYSCGCTKTWVDGCAIYE